MTLMTFAGLNSVALVATKASVVTPAATKLPSELPPMMSEDELDEKSNDAGHWGGSFTKTDAVTPAAANAAAIGPLLPSAAANVCCTGIADWPALTGAVSLTAAVTSGADTDRLTLPTPAAVSSVARVLDEFEAAAVTAAATALESAASVLLRRTRKGTTVVGIPPAAPLLVLGCPAAAGRNVTEGAATPSDAARPVSTADSTPTVVADTASPLM